MFRGNRQERKQSKNYECESSRKKQRKDLRETQGIFFTSQRKAEALEGKRYNYRRSLIHRGRGAHLLYLQKFCATSFSKKSFKHGRDSLQSILKPLFAIFQDPHAVLVSGFTRDNIHFSSLFADGNVSRETCPEAKSEEKRIFSQATHTTLPTVMILTPS